MAPRCPVRPPARAAQHPCARPGAWRSGGRRASIFSFQFSCFDFDWKHTMTNTLTSLLRATVLTLPLLATAQLALAADTKPVLDSASPCPPPEYPRASLAAEEQGAVVLGLLIGVDGKVVEAKTEKSSGFRNLDKAAQGGFAKCKFKPGTKDGKPEQMWMSMQFEWKLG
jgi:protein TonB